jgi:hypothetical protein
MSYIITGATLLSYNHQNIFLGDVARLNSLKNYTVEGFFLQTRNQIGVSGNLALESGIIRSLNEREEIIVNNINLGPAKINSINFDTNNPVRLSRYTINFDVLTSGNFDLYTLSGNLYSGITGSLSGTASLLEVFDETLNFNINDDDSYNYSQNLNIRYRKADGYESPIDLAKRLASGIFSANPNIGFIDSKYSGFYTKTGKKYFNESYNLITNDCSFTKNFNLFNNYSGDYALTLSRNIALGNDGNITVTEQGNIRGLKEPRFQIASGAVLTELNKSYSRCNNLFNAYSTSNNLTNPYSLINTGIETSRTFNNFNGEAQYNITYTNNPVFTISGYTRDSSITLNQNNLEVIEAQENGTIRFYGNKSQSFLTNLNLSALNNIFNSAASRISSSYIAQGFSNTLNMTEKSTSIPKYGNQVSYNLKYSDDKIYNTNISGVKKLVVKKSDTSPKHIYNQYIIPNKTVFLNAGGQTEMGERNVSLECIIERKNSNIYSSSPISEKILTDLKSAAIQQFAVDFPNAPVKEAFITKATYSFNSDFSLNLNLGINYTSYVDEFNNNTLML